MALLICNITFLMVYLQLTESYILYYTYTMTNREIIKNYSKNGLTLFDDILFKVASEDRRFVEELLRVFLNDDGLEVIESTVQKNLTFINNRSVVLDCYCKLSDGRLVDIEVERNDKKDKCDHQRRLRYYGSAINIKNLAKSQNFDDLPDVYMIYLTNKDIFKRGKAVYHVERVLDECNEKVSNGYHEIYINAEVNDKSNVSEVMKIMTTRDYVNDNFKVISDKKEVSNMPVEVERAIEGLREEGRQEGEMRVIKNLLSQGVISEEIALRSLNMTKKEFDKKVKELV